MLLINKNFGLLWVGQLVSQLGDRAYNIALLWWLFEKTKSPLIVSSFLIAAMLPELLIGPVAGVYIDRWNKKKTLVVSDFARGVIILTIAALYDLNLLEIWHIYMAACSISICSALFNPTTMAIIPVIVEKEDLSKANAMSQMVSGAMSVIGPLLGASSVALIGYMGVLLFNGFSYILSGIAEAFIRIKVVKIDTEESIMTSLMQGLRYIRTDARVLVVVIVIAVIHVFMGSIYVIMPFIANGLTGTGVNNLGVLESAIGVGMIVGAAYISKSMLKKFTEVYLFYAIVCLGLAIFILGTLQLENVSLLVPYAIVCTLIIIGIVLLYKRQNIFGEATASVERN
ncbi:MAG: protein of unknown function DitE [Firmicutes bacterium]|nr:protein of unknown function DitE [Bacillota bacterium]